MSIVSIAGTGEFPDVLDPRFMEMVVRGAEEEADRIPNFYTVLSSNLEVERWSEITEIGDMVPFQGAVTYKAPAQGYSGTATQKEFALGTQIERRLWELAQYPVIDRIFGMLGKASTRTRQKHAARLFNNAFSLDASFGTNQEGVALVSDSHTSPVTGVSTAAGFDNKITDALSPVALSAALVQFRKFRDPIGEPMDRTATNILVPIDMEDRLKEILETTSGLDQLEGNVNVHYNRLTPVSWFRLTDTNNWFLYNEAAMKENVWWFNAVSPEYARIEDFDHIVAKYRAYSMYTIGRADWRWVLGAEVS